MNRPSLGLRTWRAGSITARSAVASSRPRNPALRRAAPSGAQARRSETCVMFRTCSRQARRRAEPRSVPRRPPRRMSLTSVRSETPYETGCSLSRDPSPLLNLPQLRATLIRLISSSADRFLVETETLKVGRLIIIRGRIYTEGAGPAIAGSFVRLAGAGLYTLAGTSGA